jgi:hypothetical protein
MRNAMKPTMVRGLLVLLLALFLSGCASLPAGRLEGAAAYTEVPARFFGQHVLVQVNIGEAGPVWLMLDTGAQLTILDLAAARELGVAVGGATELEGIGAESVRGGVTAEPLTIHVPGSELYVLHRPVADLSPLEPFFGAPFPGVLGGDLFLRFVVEIDYARERVILHDPRRFQPREDDARLALELDRQLPFVRGAVILPDGRELSGRFLIDTGASGSLTLYAPFVRTHGLVEAMPSTIVTEAAGIGGTLTETQGRLRAFRMGPFLLDEPVASLSLAETGLTAAHGSEGHIGGEMLRRFTLTIDYRVEPCTCGPTTGSTSRSRPAWPGSGSGRLHLSSGSTRCIGSTRARLPRWRGSNTETCCWRWTAGSPWSSPCRSSTNCSDLSRGASCNSSSGGVRSPA